MFLGSLICHCISALYSKSCHASYFCSSANLQLPLPNFLFKVTAVNVEAALLGEWGTGPKIEAISVLCQASHLHFPMGQPYDTDLRGSLVIKITHWAGNLPQELIEVKVSHTSSDQGDDPCGRSIFFFAGLLFWSTLSMSQCTLNKQKPGGDASQSQR